MANKKDSNKENVKKKTSSSSSKKNTNKSTTKTTSKKTTVKKSTPKKSTTVNKKTSTKTTKPTNKVENIIVKNVELTNVLENDNNIKQTKTIKKNNKLLFLGIFVVILGIIALFVSLVANRIVDREFLSDNAITLMIITSIIIEGFGSFIIINEA